MLLDYRATTGIKMVCVNIETGHALTKWFIVKHPDSTEHLSMQLYLSAQ